MHRKDLAFFSGQYSVYGVAVYSEGQKNCELFHTYSTDRSDSYNRDSVILWCGWTFPNVTDL